MKKKEKKKKELNRIDRNCSQFSILSLLTLHLFPLDFSFQIIWMALTV